MSTPIYPRTEYEMTEADLVSLMDRCRPVPAMMIGGSMPSSQQENANAAWAALGAKMGFDHMTVRPINGKGQRFFTAIPSETESAKQERLEREAQEAKQREIARLESEIAERAAKLDKLKAQS